MTYKRSRRNKHASPTIRKWLGAAVVSALAIASVAYAVSALPLNNFSLFGAGASTDPVLYGISAPVTSANITVSKWATGDAGTGTSLLAAVDAAPQNGTQYVIGITANFAATSGTVNLKPGQNIVLMTNPALSQPRTISRQVSSTPFTGVLFNVPDSATLTIQKINIDGSWDNATQTGVANSSQVINVAPSGTCNLYDGAVIRRNRRTATANATSTEPWSTIVNRGTIVVNGGTIQDNYVYNGSSSVAYSAWGSAVYSEGTCSMPGATFTQNGAGLAPIAPTLLGGAVYQAGGSLSIGSAGQATVFTSNTAAHGGAVYQAGGTGSIASGTNLLTFSANRAEQGGALYQAGGSISITGGAQSVVFQNNAATNNGGALYLSGSSRTISNNVVFGGTSSTSSNTAGLNGGAIYQESGSTSITSDIQAPLFRQNKAINGGAYYHNGGQTTVQGGASQINFEFNSAAQAGGAICVNQTSGAGFKILENVSIGTQTTGSSNTAVNGGAIAQLGGTLAIQGTSHQVLLQGNSATSDGGGLYLVNASTAIDSNVLVGGSFTGNSNKPTNTAIRGAGIYQSGGNLSISGDAQRFLLQGNRASQHGGGLYVTGQAATNITDNVLIGGNISTEANRATSRGGGIYIDTGEVTVESITKPLDILGNTAANGAGIYQQGGSLAIRGTDAQVALSGNIASQSGAAGYFTNGSNTSVSGNVLVGGLTSAAQNKATADGAGFYISGSVATIESSGSPLRFYGNMASGNGGAIYSTGASNQTVISGNVQVGSTTSGATNSAVNGGGVYLNSGSLALNKVGLSTPSVSGNVATNTSLPTAASGGGGGLFVYSGRAFTDGAQIVNNSLANSASRGADCYLGGINIQNRARLAGGGATPFSPSVPVWVGEFGIFEITKPLDNAIYALVDVPLIPQGTSKLLADVQYNSAATGQLERAVAVRDRFNVVPTQYTKTTLAQGLYLTYPSAQMTTVLTIPSSQTVRYTGSPVALPLPTVSAGGNEVTDSIEWRYSSDGTTWQWGRPSALGTYQIQAVFGGSVNYGPASSNIGTLTVSLASYGYYWSPGSAAQTGEYTALPFAFIRPTFTTVDGTIVADIPTYSYRASSSTGEFMSGLPTDVGIWTVRTTMAGDTTVHATTYVDATVTITAVQPEIVPAAQHVYLYDGNPHFYTVDTVWGEVITSPTRRNMLPDGGSVTTEYKLSGAPISSYSTIAPTQVGSYDVRITFIPNDATNYRSATLIDYFRIEPADITPVITILSGVEYVYTGAPVEIDYRVTSGIDSTDIKNEGTTTYSYSEGVTFDSNNAVSGRPTLPGTYTVRISFQLTGGASTSTDLTLTILKATPAVSVEDKTVAYSGDAVISNSAIVTGAMAVDLSTGAGGVSYTYYTSNMTELPSAPVAVGTYYVQATYVPDMGHAALYTSASNQGSLAELKITKATLASDRFGGVVTLRIYNGQNYDVGPVWVIAPNGDDITGDGVLSYEYSAYANSEKTAQGPWSSGLPKNVSPYGYVLRVSYDGINAVGQFSTDVVVEKKELTISANNASRQYGESNPVFTYTLTGLVDGESASVLIDQPTLTTFATAQSPVGDYPVVVSGGSAINYEIARINGTLTVSPANATLPPLLLLDVAPTVVFSLNEEGARISVDAKTQDGGLITYQWYSMDDAPADLNGAPSGGVLIEGATGRHLEVSTEAIGTKYYYCEITNTSENTLEGPSSIYSRWSRVSVSGLGIASPEDTSISQVGGSELLWDALSTEETELLVDPNYPFKLFSATRMASGDYAALENLSAQELALLESTIQANLNQYPNGLRAFKILNLELHKNIPGAGIGVAATRIRDLNPYGAELTVTTDIELPISSSARKIAVIRLHEEGENLVSTFLPNEISYVNQMRFTTDKFSTYIYLYEPLEGVGEIAITKLSGAQYEVDGVANALVAQVSSETSVTLSYQWYESNSVSYSNATTLTGETSASFTPPTNVKGIRYYFCEITATNEASQSVSAQTNVVSIAVSERQDYDGVSCGTCHYADVRHEHTPYMLASGEFGKCTGCHASIKKDWTLLKDDRLTTDLGPLIDWIDTCGVSDTGCHGPDAHNGAAEVWHGLDWGRVQQGHRPREWDGSQVVTTSNSGCSSTPGSDSGCHSIASNDSPFYFGSMDLQTAHNDYWNAVQSNTTTSTPMSGVNKFAQDPASIPHGCAVCHSRGEKVLNRELINVNSTNPRFDCTTCHNGDKYFVGAYASDETSRCVGVATSQAEPQSLQSESLSTPVIQLLSSAVDSVKQLFAGMFGSEEPALSAGTVEPLPKELPLQYFPTGSLLNPDAPFKVAE